jgi:hypothetical protein
MLGQGVGRIPLVLMLNELGPLTVSGVSRPDEA